MKTWRHSTSIALTGCITSTCPYDQLKAVIGKAKGLQRRLLARGGVWPSYIAHAVHNHAWGILGLFTATSYPVIVNKYLGGDYGILIVVGGVIAAIWVGHRLKSGMDQAQSGGEATEVEAPPAATPAAPG